MSAHFERCPVCDGNEFVLSGRSRSGGAVVDCRICGKFDIGSMAAIRLRTNYGEGDRRRLSAWIRLQNLRDDSLPELRQESLASFMDGLPVFTNSQKPQLLLRALDMRSRIPGERIALDARFDFPLANAFNSEEFIFHLNHLEHLRFIEGSYALNGGATVRITHEGIAFLEAEPDSRTLGCFVAMSFSEDMTPAWLEGLKPGLEDAGYHPTRVDSVQHFGRIDLKIIGDIRAAKFVVADVTQQRPGVYFEAGFALALNKPVLWSVRRDEIDKVHFDTRQFSHVLWETPSELRERIAEMARGTLGQGAGRSD